MLPVLRELPQAWPPLTTRTSSFHPQLTGCAFCAEQVEKLVTLPGLRELLQTWLPLTTLFQPQLTGCASPACRWRSW